MAGKTIELKRVVVTGFCAVTALGNDWNSVSAKLRDGVNAVQVMEEWSDIDGLRTQLAAPVNGFSRPSHYSRKQTRSMGKVALMSTRATECAFEQAGLLGDPVIQDGSTGIAYGSCSGSPKALARFAGLLIQRNTNNITATTYVEMMSHTSAVNAELFFGIKGRIIPTSSACTSGSQAIGYAYEAIRYGHQKVMVAGGAEELCPSQVTVFDTLFATSQKNSTPNLTPQPFDQERDGLVIGEGACSLVLEELEHAKARGATIYAEVVGFATNADGVHVTSPTAETMETVMNSALQDAEISADAIGYVNAHGTATEQGDIAETIATANVFGRPVAISSLKSYYGHTLGACGSIEAWLSIEMMNRDWYAGTTNLNTVDQRCGELDYLKTEGRHMQNEYVMSNNFAFGGVNTSLIFKRWV